MGVTCHKVHVHKKKGSGLLMDDVLAQLKEKANDASIYLCRLLASDNDQRHVVGLTNGR